MSPSSRVGLHLLSGGLAVALGAFAIWSEPASAGGGIDECPPGIEDDWCLETELPGGSGDGSGGGGGGGSEPEGCGWEPVSEDDLPEEITILADYSINGVPPDDQEAVWYQWCPSPGVEWPLQWVPVADAPTAEDVAEDLYEAIQGRMPEPDVVTDPPAGVDAVIKVPVFVTVENWVDELVETRPLGGETVTVRATPELVFDTGEKGVAPVTCQGPGRSYDPDGGDLWDQAEAGDTCAHPYTLRTGVGDRPGQWPSTVTVRWSISWSSTSNEGGAFPAVDRTVSIPRGVIEARAVVVAGGQ